MNVHSPLFVIAVSITLDPSLNVTLAALTALVPSLIVSDMSTVVSSSTSLLSSGVVEFTPLGCNQH